MLKYLFPIFICAFLGIDSFAQSGITEFTYAQGSPSFFGKSKREVIDVAMCINDPSYAGMKLTKIKAYISTLEGISNPTMWLSKDLSLESSVNVPDIASYDVSLAEGMLESMELGLLEVTLDQPYILTDEPLYIGYSITVDQNTTDAQKRPIVISENINPDGLFLHMSKSIMKWMEYSEAAGGVAYIVATLEGDLPEYSLDILGNEIIFAENNKDFNATFTVSNKGSQTIENINYTYSVDGAKESEGFVELLNKVEPGIANYVNISLPFNAISGAGPHNLDLKITEVNGNANQSVVSSISCTVNVIPFIPVHRPLVEEYTGLWCGWCPRGYLAMEMIAEDFADNQVSICYHGRDEMEVTTDFPIYVSGFPKASIDRNAGIDPYYGSYSNTDYGISIDLQDAMDELAFAAIEVESTLDGEKVNVNSTVQFILDIEETNYEIGYVLVCNGLTDKAWFQSNDYAGLSGFNNSPLYVLTTWPSIVPGLVFNDVAVDVSAMMGIEGSLPSTVTTGTAYHNSFSFDISGNSLVQNKDNLVVTAFVIDKDTNKIVNANKCKINTSRVDTLFDRNNVITREYFDLNGKKVQNPSSGIYILQETLNDGSLKSSKVLIP